ncbi:hypothetical protein Tsubulata_028383 [Turnera subulata]|uniref:FAF domain-containing protein n=1 Tax=Turnera subulata TaxID=218843 RepID=A0A9Q0FDT4_9ROSI|nr:hypothetical protein Tsubulata_028383 [Turnera subulata]
MSSSSNYCQLAPSSSKPNNSANSPSTPKPVVISNTTATNLYTPNADMGGWSFLQSLDDNNSKVTAAAQDYDEEEKQNKVYVPPKSNRSSSALSGRSREMCTESLGSETGSDGVVEMASLSLENDYEPRERPVYRSLTRRGGVIKKGASASVPRPLSSISGSISVQMSAHREGGRLELKAEAVPPRTNLQVERINGRLRISDLSIYPLAAAASVAHLYDLGAAQRRREAAERRKEARTCPLHHDYSPPQR